MCMIYVYDMYIYMINVDDMYNMRTIYIYICVCDTMPCMYVIYYVNDMI